MSQSIVALTSVRKRLDALANSSQGGSITPCRTDAVQGAGTQSTSDITEENGGSSGVAATGFRKQYITTALLNDDAGLFSTGFNVRPEHFPICSLKVGISVAIDTERSFYGFTSATDLDAQLGSSAPAESYIGLAVDTSLGETSFQLAHDNGSGTPLKVDTGLLGASGDLFLATFDFTEAGLVKVSVEDAISGTVLFESLVTQSLPASDTSLRAMLGKRTLDATARGFFFHNASWVYHAKSLV